jgi:ABC-type multidrug transport system permease subunit
LYVPFGALSRKNYIVDDPTVEANIRLYLRLNILISIAYILSWIIIGFNTLVFIAGAGVLSAFSVWISNRLTRELKTIERPRSAYISSMGWGQVLCIVIPSFLLALLFTLFLIIGWNTGGITHLQMLANAIMGIAFGGGAGAVLWVKIKAKKA